MMPEVISRRKHFIINAVYITILIIIAGIIFLSARFIMPFWIALFLAAIMQPLTRFLGRKIHIKKKHLATLVWFFFYLIIGSMVVWIFMEVSYLLDEVFLNLPSYYDSTIKSALHSLGDFLKNMFSVIPAQFRPNLDMMQTAITSATQQFVSNISQKGMVLAGSFFSGIPSGFLSSLITILLSFFISTQYDEVISFIKCQLPEKARGSVSEIKQLITSSLYKYLKSTVILMFITMAELMIGFLVIGISNPIGLAVGIALFDALPVFGTGTIMIPWAVMELINGNYTLAAEVFVVYCIIDIMRNILEPKIIGTQFEMNPIVALITVYLGYQLFGIIGMVVLLITVYILLTFHRVGKIKLYNSLETLQTDNQENLEVTHGK